MHRLPLLGEKQEAKENGTNLTFIGDKTIQMPFLKKHFLDC
uniref:Transmembrane protein 87A n=2 Tax=Homininae TaxID=207598 RepID=H3BSZ0_HUMAN